MEADGHLDAVVTRNVDGLHAGSGRIVALHGTSQYVRCDDCGATEPAEPVFERGRARVTCCGRRRFAVGSSGVAAPENRGRFGHDGRRDLRRDLPRRTDRLPLSR
ncbi:hypothetical protein BRC76_05105 [Halobacteriales archaeon QH_8_67_36]|nr:MAG: hypothetical protein BRC76_05105 [Halobacteriales archaeon QH_8_67_36]